MRQANAVAGSSESWPLPDSATRPGSAVGDENLMRGARCRAICPPERDNGGTCDRGSGRRSRACGDELGPNTVTHGAEA